MSEYMGLFPLVSPDVISSLEAPMFLRPFREMNMGLLFWHLAHDQRASPGFESIKSDKM
jgi:hypothetical protein